jgi:drug/metabolite transporter (DMT)-like permease
MATVILLDQQFNGGETVAAVLALGSALTFGVADFLGGLASRRARALVVTLLANVAGGVVVLLVAPVVGGSPSLETLVVGGVTGLFGVLGLVAYFHALATGPMGITAPLAALVGAVVPVGIGLLRGEQPGPFALGGMLLGVLATVLVSLPAGTSLEMTRTVRRAARWAVVGGLGFGLFFVGLDLAPDDSGLWPLVGARAFSIPVIASLVLVRRSAAGGGWPWRLGIASGVLDMAANTLFLLATRSGLLSVTSVLASLYPAVVALLAGVVLHERLSGLQRLGVPVALAAVMLLSV